MTAVWSALQTSDLAVRINLSRWVYAGIATAHVLAITVLIGSILILDLRLVGFARRLDVAQLARLVVPVAGTALGCAVISGGLLFIGRAAQYAAFDLFQLKIAMIAIAMHQESIWLGNLLPAHFKPKLLILLSSAATGVRLSSGI